MTSSGPAQDRAPRRDATPGWAAPLVHPVPLAAVLVLAINDHWIKGAGIISQAVAGKLSDVAGLFYFPLLLVALTRGLAALARRDLPRCDGWIGPVAITTTAVVFSAAKLSLPFNALLARTWGLLERDPTDLLTLPVLLLSWLWLRSVGRAES